MYINIHSHESNFDKAQKHIVNLSRNWDSIFDSGYYSAGINPWYIKKDLWPEEMMMLKKAVLKENALAVGECGLDKVCDTDFALQQELFSAQVILANDLKKPLIVHCVRAFEEVLHILKQQNNKVPAIFHGFNKNKELAQSLMSKGYFLSFGKSILNEKKGGILPELPIEKIFFETDNSMLKIEEIYSEAAAVLNLSLQQLQSQIIKNAQQVFGDKLFNV